HRRRHRAARRDRRHDPARDGYARRKGRGRRPVHRADGRGHVHGAGPARVQGGPACARRRGSRPLRRRLRRGEPGRARRAPRAARRRAARVHAPQAGRRAGALLPNAQGADAPRLLHFGDRLHPGDALRRDPGTLRPVRAVRAGRQDLGTPRVSGRDALERQPADVPVEQTAADAGVPEASAARARRVAGCAAVGLALVAVAAATIGAAQDAPAEDWFPLFNGRDLDGWVVKIRGHELGDNFAQTFRVVDGLLTVSYDGYRDFAGRFGHLFYRTPFSHYRLRVEYRFVGEPGPNVEAWAHRNSGVMLHAQPPETMPREQDFPISVEFQFLGRLGDGVPRPTGSVCSPGTHVVYRGRLDETHCIRSSAPTIDGDRWVIAEALVLGGERIVHYIDGEPVLE